MPDKKRHTSTSLPPEFLQGLDERGRWMYETIHEMSQAQTRTQDHVEAIKQRLDEGSTKIKALETEVEDLRRTRLILSSKWSVVVLITGSLLWPILLLFAAKWVRALPALIHLPTWLGK